MILESGYIVHHDYFHLGPEISSDQNHYFPWPTEPTNLFPVFASKRGCTGQNEAESLCISLYNMILEISAVK